MLIDQAMSKLIQEPCHVAWLVKGKTISLFLHFLSGFTAIFIQLWHLYLPNGCLVLAAYLKCIIRASIDNYAIKLYCTYRFLKI